MEPIALSDEDRVCLPPHEVVTYAEEQPEYRPLQVARLHGLEGRLVSRWTFTADERARIAAGEDVFIELLTFGQPLQPILPTVGLHERCPAD